MAQKLKRIWKNYNAWEDYKNGLYRTEKSENEERILFDCENLLKSKSLFCKTLMKVINDWPECVDHNLSYEGSNRLSYLGQAACCYLYGASIKETCKAWNRLTKEEQDTANSVAQSFVEIYENYIYEEK